MWLAALWVLALALPFIIQHHEANRPDDRDNFPLIITGFFLVEALVLARVIRLDAPGRRGIHFLATRPVPGGTLLTGKILRLLACCSHPVLLTQPE